MRLLKPSLLLFSFVLLASLTACDSDGGADPPPPAPSELTTTSEDGAVTLAWSAPSGENAEGYNVYRSESSFSDPSGAQKLNGSPINGTSYRDAGVENETTYYYRVTAVDASGSESSLSGQSSATPADVTSPSAPSGLEGTSEDGAVALAWTAPNDEDVAGYNVYRSQSSFSSNSDAQNVSGEGLASETSYRDSEAENGTKYYYRVAAVDEAGNESDLSGEVEKTPFPDPPDEP